MDPNAFPTKGNLILNRNMLKFSELGYDLLDKKRSVLLRELMELNDLAKDIQKKIDGTFNDAYLALQKANIELGMNNVERISHGVMQEDSVKIRIKSVMGVELPVVTYGGNVKNVPDYGFENTSSSLDSAVFAFNAVKDLIVSLSMVENSAYRLALAIKKTQRRANALKNVTIPKYKNLVKEITEYLEEHDRDEFTRLKIAKKNRGRETQLNRGENANG